MNRKAAFTLVELLVAIALIGVLVALLLVTARFCEAIHMAPVFQ